MPHIFRPFMIVVLILLSHGALANSLLNQHVMATSQAISAFYMYSLTEGDERYQAEYKKFLSQAHGHFQSLKKQDPKLVTKLEPLWADIQKEKDYKITAESEFNVPSFMRIQYRNYLENVYQLVGKTIISESNLAEQMTLIALDVEVMAARFFDVSNATMGVFTLSSSLFEIDPQAMAENMKQRLAKLQTQVNDKVIKKNLRSVSGKWQFIEGGVINYNQEAAFLLVYYNKKKINKLIVNSQKALAAL